MSEYVGTAQPVLLSPQRGFFGPMVLIPDCVVEEHGSDRLEITDQPVEQSADISDHAFKLPAEIVLRYGWSNSTPMVGSETYSQQMYEQLLALQVAMTPFTVVTGKRIYQNMMIAGIDQTTDAKTEFALLTVITCREVILVSTTSVSVSPSASQAPNVTPPVQSGTQSPVQRPVPNSILKGASNYFFGQSS